MSRVLVTGSAGFIGQRVAALLEAEQHDVLRYDASDSVQHLQKQVATAEYVFHFAGVNRPSDPAEFETINARLTETLCSLVEDAQNDAVVILASSTQALLDNPYGISKRRAEIAVEDMARRGGRGVIFRLPNVFGPGARPNYNSVVATFAHHTAQNLPIEIHEAKREITLVYVHDVARAMVNVLGSPPTGGDVRYVDVSPVTSITLDALAEALRRFRASRTSAQVPDVSADFGRKLYATYLSYLKPDDFAYTLAKSTDDRGSLAEFLKSDGAGQFFISRTRPGAVRGNHFHLTKTEKFFVVEGDAVIRFRRVDGTGEVIAYHVSGSDFRVVDIPPDYTHSIENIGANDLVVLFWASEILNPKSPDTTPLKVQ